MPSSYARGYARHWPTPTRAAVAKAIAARPAAATSWSSNASIAQRTIGKWRVLSSATCASTTTCPSTTSAPPPTSPRRAWCATSSTRPSIHSGQLNRRSRFGAMQRSGWRSSAAFRVFISKARSTVGHITGPSGVGTANARARTSALRNSHRCASGLVPARPRRRAMRMVLSRAARCHDAVRARLVPMGKVHREVRGHIGVVDADLPILDKAPVSSQSSQRGDG